MRGFASRQIILTTSAHYNIKKFFAFSHLRSFGRDIKALVLPVSLSRLVLPHQPHHLHRANLLRSHPLHFALTPSLPPHHHLSQSKCRGLPPPQPLSVWSVGIASDVDLGCCEEQVKSGNFNWSHRQF